jgi:hypothetical protein
MPIRTRISDRTERIELRRKALGRHPILKIGSRHNAVFQTILEGNVKGGFTAAQIDAYCGQYHPQILKDLIDYRLVRQLSRNANNEFKYVADPAAKGTYIQEVTVEVELLEDEHGRFFTRTTMKGRHPTPGRIIRSLGTRKIHFKVPLPEEASVTPVAGDVRVDDLPDTSTPRYNPNVTIDAEASEHREPLLLEAKATIVED